MMKPHLLMSTLTFLAGFSLPLPLPAQVPPEPAEVPGLSYDVEFFSGTAYDASIPTVEEILGFRAGDRAAFPAEVDRAMKAWNEASDRTKLVEYARSHEGRPLTYMIVSSPRNMARLDEIQSGLARLADPRGLDQSEADRLLAELPATAWMAYSIHGDETSGTDASLAVTYHLTAGTSSEVTELLENVVVLIDPMNNPDGRHRFLTQIAEHRAVAPNLDNQSLLHTGYWPYGRGNHYLFDLNRDWILGIHPETRGRVREAAAWHPLLMVDIHEMGSLDTFLFGSAREPRNPNFPARRQYWQSVFAREQSEAFDAHNWKYYTGEWNEGWYPGYSDSWGEFRGAVGILYEQASIAEDAVRQPEGTLTSYREATHHQAVSSMANLSTLSENSGELLAEFLAEKREAVSPTGRWSGRTFAILPTANRSRLDRFMDQMELQGFESWIATDEVGGVAGVDQLGRSFSGRTLPVGTILIPSRQPQAPLLSTMLQFDNEMPEEYLSRERDSILRGDGSTIYDITSWNLTMMFGLEALTLTGNLPATSEPWQPPAAPVNSVTSPAAGPPVGWAIDGADDNAVVAAARLMERGVLVRVADEAFELGGAALSRGSLLVLPADNVAFDGDLPGQLVSIASDLEIEIVALSSGLGEGELADIGGAHFTLLEQPRIAIATRGSVSPLDYGEIWHLLDLTLGIRHSQIESESLSSTDLRRYNVLVLPNRWDGSLPESSRQVIADWVEDGGTLIATSRSATAITGADSDLSRVRRLPDVLDELDRYEQTVLREWMAQASKLPASDRLWAHTVAQSDEYPWSSLSEVPRPPVDERRRRDAWQRQFMPQGATLAARVDQRHWLTYGTGPVLPILFLAGYYGNAGVLMADDGIAAPIRFGVLSDNSDAEVRRVGWGPAPAGKDLHLRMSGLLWPEAAERIANSAWVTRERKGNGQVILFAGPAVFRGTTHGAARVLTNAMIYGPGLGARQPIRP